MHETAYITNSTWRLKEPRIISWITKNKNLNHPELLLESPRIISWIDPELVLFESPRIILFLEPPRITFWTTQNYLLNHPELFFELPRITSWIAQNHFPEFMHVTTRCLHLLRNIKRTCGHALNKKNTKMWYRVEQYWFSLADVWVSRGINNDLLGPSCIQWVWIKFVPSSNLYQWCD